MAALAGIAGIAGPEAALAVAGVYTLAMGAPKFLKWLSIVVEPE